MVLQITPHGALQARADTGKANWVTLEPVCPTLAKVAELKIGRFDHHAFDGQPFARITLHDALQARADTGKANWVTLELVCPTLAQVADFPIIRLMVNLFRRRLVFLVIYHSG